MLREMGFKAGIGHFRNDGKGPAPLLPTDFDLLNWSAKKLYWGGQVPWDVTLKGWVIGIYEDAHKKFLQASACFIGQ